MLARIKFIQHTNSNRINKDVLNKLSSFLGEELEVNQLKFGENGKPETLNWRETFNKEKAENDSDYTLVTPVDLYQIADNNTYIVDLEVFTTEFPNLEISIKGVPKSISQNNNDLINEMNKVAEKIEEAKNRFEKVVEFNQKCEVHVPNLGLMNINKLAFATDYCTEALQQLLFQGWRIIAVCPQPDQRRPDYILGMHDSNIDNDVYVEHFNGDGREGYLKDKDKRKKENYQLI